MNEEEERLSSRKAVVAMFLFAALILACGLIFFTVVGQRACSGS